MLFGTQGKPRQLKLSYRQEVGDLGFCPWECPSGVLSVSHSLKSSVRYAHQNNAKKALQIAVKRREANSKGEKERYKHLIAEFQRIARRDKKAINAKKSRKTTEWERLELSSRKLGIPRHFMQRWAR